ncbi:MAG: aldehyde ferredoxin oxidoreductase family protein [Desulfobacteraceae bacterium]|nr:aldehyde ferredoxin oxidoreductase family protein [Desulfobacteraceae bacterium]
MKGFYGRILRIDLSTSSFTIDPIGDDILRKYLGGKGLGSYLLYRYNPQGVDPLSPENCLIFTTGPSCAGSVWGSSRYGVFTKSPQTGFYSESYSGGKTPVAVDATGYDAIVIHGKADAPAVLVISPEDVGFFPADDLWGKDTFDTEDAVNARFSGSDSVYKRTGAVVIGPAGENLVRFAVIENDYWRSAGRTGVGTVMGSKLLKAIVFQGDRKRAVHDADRLKTISKTMAMAAKDHPGVAAYKSKGTPMMVQILNNANAFPTKYWSEGKCGHWEKIGADALHGQCSVTPHACLKCYMACGRMTEVRDGRHAGLKLEGPEYETIYAFGGLCMVDSIEEIIYLNDLCDRLGMDTITTGNLCAFTIEAFRQGKVDYPVDYGQVDAIAALIKKIAGREGIGGILANGIVAAAEQWDMADTAVHVKGLEPAGYDPRVLKGMGLSYATSDRGACHLRTTFYKPELSGVIAPEAIEGKAELVVDFEDRLILFDALILCRFYRDLYAWQELGQLIQALTGIAGDKETLRGIAVNIADLVRKFNLREGLTADDDRLPRYLNKPFASGGGVITPGELETMRADYYRLRGWDADGRLNDDS